MGVWGLGFGGFGVRVQDLGACGRVWSGGLGLGFGGLGSGFVGSWRFTDWLPRAQDLGLGRGCTGYR